MAQLLWEVKILLCDICKERPLTETIKINGEYKGVCSECKPNKEVKNEKV